MKENELKVIKSMGTSVHPKVSTDDWVYYWSEKPSIWETRLWSLIINQLQIQLVDGSKISYKMMFTSKQLQEMFGVSNVAIYKGLNKFVSKSKYSRINIKGDQPWILGGDLFKNVSYRHGKLFVEVNEEVVKSYLRTVGVNRFVIYGNELKEYNTTPTFQLATLFKSFVSKPNHWSWVNVSYDNLRNILLGDGQTERKLYQGVKGELNFYERVVKPSLKKINEVGVLKISNEKTMYRGIDETGERTWRFKVMEIPPSIDQNIEKFDK